MKKILSIIITGTLAVAIGVTAFATNLFNFANKDTDNGGSSDNNVISEPIPMPSSLTFRAAGDSEYSSITVEAIVSPSDAFEKSVNWSAAFSNPNSAWATGKAVADYLTVTPASSGSAKATIKCLQPFGEQITVTVSSVSNPTIKASCTVDFLQRLKVTSFNSKVIGDSLDIPLNEVCFDRLLDTTKAFVFGYQNLAYTLSANLDFGVVFDEAFINAVNNRLTALNYSYGLSNKAGEFSSFASVYSSGQTGGNFSDCLRVNDQVCEQMVRDVIKGVISDVIKNNNGTVSVGKIVGRSSYQGESSTTYTRDFFEVPFNFSAIEVASITLTPSYVI